MPKYIYIFFVFFGVYISFAQQNHPLNISDPYHIHHYTLKDGLSQVSINDITEDNQGFIWVATQAGLNRFDGTSFKSYHNNPDDHNSICGNFINTLLSDQNRIWIGTRSAGLCYFDTETFQFHNFKSIQHLEVMDIETDHFHTIYASVSDKGIATITKDKNDTYQIQFIDFFIKKNVNTTEIYISKNGKIWIGTKEGRLFYGNIKKDPSKIIFIEYPLGQKFEKIHIINSDSKTSIWVGTDHKLYQINLITNLVLPISLYSRNKNNSLIIYDIKWKDGDMWVGTGEGLFRYNSSTYKLMEIYSHNEQSPNSLSNNTVYTLFTDTNNQLWAGTGKYLNLLYRSSIFHNITHNSGNNNSLNSNIIFSILKDDNDLWIGTSDGGINLIRKQKYYSFTKESHYIPSNVCFSLLTDSDGLWAGTKEGLVILNDYKKDYLGIRTSVIVHDPKDSSSLSNNLIRYIYRDSKENIWLCTEGGGLNLFTGNLKKGEFSFKHFTHKYEDTLSISSDKVKFITQIHENSYWVGTNKGLNILSFKDHNFSNPVFKRLRIKDSIVLTNDVIYNILKDKDSGVWIGTTGGIYFYNFKSPELKPLKQKNDLNNNVIYGLLKDSGQNIWFSTNKGLSHYDRITGIFTNYNQEDGISSEEFDLNASFKDPSGLLYFGGINGITYFDPTEVVYSPKESKLYIDNIQITNISKNSIETIQVKENETKEIHSRQFPFYVNFSDINLSYYKNTEFAYRLKPDDNHWNLIQDKRQIQFLSLAPGDYTLEIQGVTKGTVWNESKPLTLPISVIPLWWQSHLAYFIYFILFLILIYSFYYYTLKRKLEHQENLRLTELDEMKTKLYGNITHELRTPLTVIMGMTETIRQNIDPDDLKIVKSKFNILSRNTKKLLYLINQMLDLSKVESGSMIIKPVQTDIVPFIKVNLDSFHLLASNKNIDLIFYSENNKIVMDFDPDKFPVIISNLLSNAIKFTPENERIILHVKKIIRNEKPYLIIKIKDNGIGMKKEDQEHIFDRFYQVNGTHMGGTGIGLSLTKELVQLMNGNIRVKSELNKGTEFSVEIPITNKAPILEGISYTPEEQIVHKAEEFTEELHDEHGKDLPQIIIIEDNKDVAHYIASDLMHQFEISFAQDGKEGIERAFEIIPDLIITDLMMPKADGFKVCDTLKNDERTSHIPIIMLTARTFEKDKIKGLAHGADAYLTKPFNKNELLIRIEQLILQRKKIQEKYQKTGFLKIDNSSPETTFINKCKTLILENLQNENYRSAQLAFHINLSESQLYRKLKALTNLSTAVFIREIRLQAAIEMLQKTEKNISEIAYSCGFSNPDWFSRSFKEKFGFAPSDYRQQL